MSWTGPYDDWTTAKAACGGQDATGAIYADMGRDHAYKVPAINLDRSRIQLLLCLERAYRVTGTTTRPWRVLDIGGYWGIVAHLWGGMRPEGEPPPAWMILETTAMCQAVGTPLYPWIAITDAPEVARQFQPYDVVLLSNALHMVESPWSVVDYVRALNPPAIVLHDVPVDTDAPTRIYAGTVPLWVFNRRDLDVHWLPYVVEPDMVMLDHGTGDVGAKRLTGMWRQRDADHEHWQGNTQGNRSDSEGTTAARNDPVSELRAAFS